MKILVIGHAYIAQINRLKWKFVASKYPDIQIKVLIPKFWPAHLFNLESGDLTKENLSNCEFIALKTFKAGNEVLYGYKFLDLIKLLKSFKPDLIHVEQGDNAFSYFQTILFSKIFCPKAKFTFFTWVNWKPKRSLKYKFLWRIVEKINLFFSSGAFVGNDVAGNILKDKKFFKPTQILLQLGVDQKKFKPAEKIEQKNRIGFIGRIVVEKGVFDLIQVFAELIKIHPSWKLEFVGNGAALSDLKQYVCDNKLDANVSFYSPVVHEKIVDILHGLDILVLPSYDTPDWKEQFGHVLIEAMACKVPVIGSAGGYIPQVINDAGLIFEQRNKKDLFNCLKCLIENKKIRKELAQKGFDRFEANYSYEIIAEKTYLFWSKILNN